MSVADVYFDALYRASDDPWSMRTRWYEQRKRDLTLAALPHQSYARAFEPGCANGEMSLRLAERCRSLLCCDTSPLAIGVARQRLLDRNNVRFIRARLPRQWPTGEFDLIVFSEIGYYLDDGDLATVIDLARNSLTPHGVLLACHWRPLIEGCGLTGDQVHTALDARLQLPRLSHYQDADLVLDVWSRDSTSVAQREGLTGDST